ncbi:MAG: Trk system potassium transporter TrkA [Hyphomonadaceae bacterium]
MRVLICGAGRVGQGIARVLAREKHDITIVDENSTLIDEVTTEFDVRGVVGHAAHPDVLKAAGAAEVEMIIAVTYYDEINMVICQIAHTLFSVPTKIARVRAQAYLDPSWKQLFSSEGLHIDMVISPEVEVGQAVLQRFRTPDALMTASFANQKLQVISLEVTEDSPLAGTALDQISGLFPELEARIIGMGRGDTVFAPRSNDSMRVGDRAYFAVKADQTSRLNVILRREEKELHHVVIIGGGHVGLYVASKLEQEKQVRVRLIEYDEKQAEHAVANLRKTIVIHGDGLKPEILDEAGIRDADFAISLTDDDKTNLLICNLASRGGAKRTLALVNSPDLAALSRDMNVDAVLDPRALTVSKILLRMRRGRILSLQSLEDGAAEIAEGVTLATSSLIGKPVDYDNLPEGITVAALCRDGEVLFPGPGVTAQTGDHLIVFFERHMTRTVEQYFRVSPDFF